MAEQWQRVKNFVDSHEPTEPILPLTHVTTMFGFRTIMTGMTLEPKECRVFNENLLYLFYGRPSYRATQVAGSELNWNLPIGFILNPDAVSTIKRIFPFDSGAFANGLYGETFHAESEMSSFRLTPKIISTARYTSAFYSGNAHYYRGKSDINLDLGNFDFELQGLSYLSKRPGMQTPNGKSTADERASTVEIQTAESLTIKDTLMALIVPESLMADTAFMDAIERWEIDGSKILSYAEILGPGSESWVGVFYEKVENLYRNEGFL